MLLKNWILQVTSDNPNINKTVTIEAFNWLTNLSTEDYDSQTEFTTDLVFAADDITVSKGITLLIRIYRFVQRYFKRSLFLRTKIHKNFI